MTAPTTSAAAQEYLAEVERELADLAADERAELLEDLALHLAALEEEPDARPLVVRLGAASDYAAELRAAAGLPDRAAAPSRRGRARLLAARLAGSTVVRELRGFVPQLAPAWWVLRGYLVVLLPCLWHVNRTADFPVPAPLGSHLLGVVLVGAAVVGSVALGRRRPPRPVTAGVVLLDALLAVAAASVALSAPARLAVHDAGRTVILNAANGTTPLMSVSGPVTNIFPFAADGRPLTGVLLFDQDGRPLPTAVQQWWADGCRRVLAQPRAVDGVPVAFSYPHQYVLDPSGTTLAGGVVSAGQCQATLAPPKVPLPVFPRLAAQPAPSRAAR